MSELMQKMKEAKTLEEADRILRMANLKALFALYAVSK